MCFQIIPLTFLARCRNEDNGGECLWVLSDPAHLESFKKEGNQTCL